MEAKRFRTAGIASAIAAMLALGACGQQQDQSAGQQVDQAAERSAAATMEAREQSQTTITEARQESQEAIQEARQETQEALQQAREQLDEAQKQARENLDQAQQTSRQAYDEASQEAREKVAELRTEAQEASQEARQAAEETRQELRSSVQEARDSARDAEREAQQARADAQEATQTAEQRREQLAEVRSDRVQDRGASANQLQEPPSTSSMGAASATSSMGAAAAMPDDAQITAQVNARLAADTDLRSHGIDVETDERDVTLSGTVPTQDAKMRAERLAREVQHVGQVKNELEVDATSAQSGGTVQPSTATMALQEPSDTRTMGAAAASATGNGNATGSSAGQGRSLGQLADDVGITAQINTGFSVDKDLKATEIDVDTRQGVVTLSGRVPSEDARKRAEQIARNVDESVREVRNELRVGGEQTSGSSSGSDTVATGSASSGGTSGSARPAGAGER